MKKIVLVLVVAFLVSFSVFATLDNLSVPLTSDAYRIISVSEIRGIIPAQTDVKPYSFAKVKALLKQISSSDLISGSERNAIDETLAELERSFGKVESTKVKDVLNTGYLSIINNDNVMVNAGAKLQTKQTFSTEGAFDSRFKVNFNLTGDVFSRVSFNMTLGMIADRLDHRAFLATDFTTEIEGVYMNVFSGGGGEYTSPFDHYAIGYQMSPELGASIWEDKFTARFASVKRDWGPGLNNLALSGSARAFDAIELQFAPTSRIAMSVLVGTLGKAWVEMEGEPVPVGDSRFHQNQYDNNFSLQRVEVDLFEGFRFSIYESVVWRKRAELAYWNPLSVYMFAQNYLGDFDNVLAGMDFSYTIKKVGKLYLGFAMDEFNSLNPKYWLSYARNIVALQGGMNINVPGFSFSKLTLQATYIPPFFGTHYLYDGRKSTSPLVYGIYGAAYVNKGQGLSYPLYPDSVELLLKYETTLPYGISLAFVAKDQMRSAQYSTNLDVGTGLDDYIRYSLTYEQKHFFSYIWNNIVDLEINGRKSFENLPFTLNLGLQCLIDSRRSYSFNDSVKHYAVNAGEGDNEYTYEDDESGSEHLFNTGNGTIMGNDWTTDVRFCFSIGIDIYY